MPVLNYFTSDNQVERTCRFLRERGYDVRPNLPATEGRDGFQVHRFRTSTSKTIRRGINVTAARAFGAYVAGAPQWAERVEPAVYHLNDYNTLFLLPLARLQGSRVVYDMHELFQDLDYLNSPRPVNRAVAAVSRVGLRGAEATICVSPPIRDELARLTRRPVYVVRNVPEARHLEGEEDPTVSTHLRDGRRHLLYLGGLQVQKGDRWMLQMLSHLPSHYALTCLAGRAPKNEPFLEEARRLGVRSRLEIFDYVPQAKLYPTIRYAWAGVSAFVPNSRIYDFALPNKLFEYLLAGLPVIASNARAQAELVRSSGLGIVLPLDAPAEAAAQLLSWIPPEVTPQAVHEAGLTWEQERRALARVYDSLGIDVER
ncbi:MAG: glycosyltransferase [Myxococcota bacterium]